METTVQLDEQLLAEAKQCAEQAHRSLSEVVAEALQEKLAKSAAPSPNGATSPKTKLPIHPEIQRITGLAPTELDAETVYREHLFKRHR